MMCKFINCYIFSLVIRIDNAGVGEVMTVRSPNKTVVKIFAR